MSGEQKRSSVTVIIDTDGERTTYILPAVENVVVEQDLRPYRSIESVVELEDPRTLPARLSFSFDPVLEDENSLVTWYATDSTKLPAGSELELADRNLAYLARILKKTIQKPFRNSKES